MKRIGLFLLVVCLLMPCAALTEPVRYEGAGCETPEKAVRLYLDGAKEGDLQKMLSAFAIETYVQHYDLEAQLKRLRTYTFGQEVKLANSNDLFTAINVEGRKSNIVQSILLQTWSLAWPESDPFVPTQLKEDAEATAFVAGLRLDAWPMQKCEFRMFIDPAVLNDKYSSEANLNNLQKRAAVLGADEIKSMVAVLSIDGKGFALGCDVMRYGERWYLCALHGNIAMLQGIASQWSGLMPI